MFALTIAGATVFGAALALLAAYLKAKKPETAFTISFSELISRVSVVVFGVALGSVALFGQKWIEELNKNVDLASESLGEIDILVAQLKSETEHSYFNNDRDFLEILEACKPIVEKANENYTFCVRASSSEHSLDYETLLTAIDLFDYEMPQEFLSEFSEKIEKNPFIKRVISPQLIFDAFRMQHEMSERYRIVSRQVKSLFSNESEKNVIKNIQPAPGPEHQALIQKMTHSLCCAVKLLYDESERLSHMATIRSQQFCDFRREIGASAVTRADPLVRILAAARINEISERVERSTSPDSCRFNPAKIGRAHV